MEVGKAFLYWAPNCIQTKFIKTITQSIMSFDSVSNGRANCCMMTINVHDLIVTSNSYILLVEIGMPSHLFIANTHSKFENLFEEVVKLWSRH